MDEWDDPTCMVSATILRVWDRGVEKERERDAHLPYMDVYLMTCISVEDD
jgi:hypothetical protein